MKAALTPHTRVDMHIHTTASDGTWTPAVLLHQLKAMEIGLFSVTDHDSTGNIAETRRLAAETGIAFVAGVEVSATMGSRPIHILGYGIDENNAQLQALLHYNSRLMEDIDHESIRQLAAAGLPVNYDEYLSYHHVPERGGWKSLSYLVDKGLCSGIADFFANLFTADKGIAFPEFKEPRQVIEIIRAAGGIPVLAHPGSEFHGTALEDSLEFLAREDIGGIECFHPGHDPATTEQAVAWCRSHNLIITGGSDCHGDFLASRLLGCPLITLADLMLEKLI